MKLLLENGADVNAEGERFGNALQAASFRGSEAIIKVTVSTVGLFSYDDIARRQHYYRKLSNRQYILGEWVKFGL